MKLIADYNMAIVMAISASSSAGGFPVANLLQYDPDLIWRAAAFDVAINIVLDLGAASAINHIWLNNANFTAATIQANSTNAWASPAVSKEVVLADDDVGVYKGFFDLSVSAYRYVRLVIPVQALLFNDTLPSLGNVIVGQSEDIFFASWSPNVYEDVERFQSDSGSLSITRSGKPRHVFSASMRGTKAELSAAPFKRWLMAVIFTNMGSVGDSYLVYAPIGRNATDHSPINCERSFSLEERV